MNDRIQYIKNLQYELNNTLDKFRNIDEFNLVGDIHNVLDVIFKSREYMVYDIYNIFVCLDEYVLSNILNSYSNDVFGKSIIKLTKKKFAGEIKNNIDPFDKMYINIQLTCTLLYQKVKNIKYVFRTPFIYNKIVSRLNENSFNNIIVYHYNNSNIHNNLIKMASRLVRLSLNNVCNMDNFNMFDNLKILSLSFSIIMSSINTCINIESSLPNSLIYLRIYNCEMMPINIVKWPANLEILDLSNIIVSLTLPKSLIYLRIHDCMFVKHPDIGGTIYIHISESGKNLLLSSLRFLYYMKPSKNIKMACFDGNPAYKILVDHPLNFNNLEILCFHQPILNEFAQNQHIIEPNLLRQFPELKNLNIRKSLYKRLKNKHDIEQYCEQELIKLDCDHDVDNCNNMNWHYLKFFK